MAGIYGKNGPAGTLEKSFFAPIFKTNEFLDIGDDD